MNKFNTEITKICCKFKILSACKTKKNKEIYLKEFGEDADFSKAIEYLLNNDKISGIKSSKLKKQIDKDKLKIKQTYEFDTLTFLLDFLVNNNTGPDNIVYSVQQFLNKIENDEYKDIISQLITKDLKCGVTDLTAYGFIPGLERNWRERKGHSLIDVKTGEILTKKIKGKNVIVSLKLDGYRCKLIKKGNSIVIKSASGKTIEDILDIPKEALLLPDGIYDCECQALGEFENSTARYNATSKIITKDGPKKGLEIVVFDYINEKNVDKFFNFEKIKITKKDRLKELKKIIPKDLTHIRLIPIYMEDELVTDEIMAKIIEIYEHVVEQGEEGLIIDIADAYYERTKGNTMFKLKPELTGDFKVIDLTEGTGKDKGKLGAFIIEYKNNTVNVGSGLTDSIRENVWKDKDAYLNKLIEVKYFGETQDEKTGLPSLRLPRFKRFRHDKNDVSYD